MTQENEVSHLQASEVGGRSFLMVICHYQNLNK